MANANANANVVLSELSELSPYRINQYEAESFDEYMINLLVDTVKSSFSEMNSFKKYTEEIKLVIKIIYFSFKLLKDKVTEGQALYNVKYYLNNNSKFFNRVKVIGFLFCKIIVPYLIHKIDDYFNTTNTEDNSLKKLLRFLFKFSDFLLKFADLTNFIFFLTNSKFPTIWDRLFNMKYVSLDPDNQSQLSFNFLMKKILWSQLSKIIIFFFNFSIGKKGLQSVFAQLESVLAEDTDMNKEHMGAGKCAICKNTLTMATLSEVCGHVFCYYCINLHFQKGNDTCPV